MEMKIYFEGCRNAVELAGSVDLFEEDFGEIVGPFEAEHHHAQVASGRNFETRIGQHQFLKLLGQMDALKNDQYILEISRGERKKILRGGRAFAGR